MSWILWISKILKIVCQISFSIQIGLLQAVEEEVGVKMTEWNLDDIRISEILLQVSSSRRQNII